MPFSHLTLKCAKPKNLSYLWKLDRFPEDPRHIGDHIKKRRFVQKMSAKECREILGVDKSTLIKWEQGKHFPIRKMRKKIVRFLGYDPFSEIAK